MMIEACAFRAGEERAWDAYVRGSRSSSHYHLSGWRGVIGRSYGHRALYLWARRNGQIVGILPLVLIRSSLFGHQLVSLPFVDGGGVCAEDADIGSSLYDKALELCRAVRAKGLQLRHYEPSGLDVPPHGLKVTLILDLAETPEGMWNRLHPKVRNQVRKAQRSGLTTRWTGADGLAEFYGVFAANMRDLGSPVHSPSLFATILEEFPESATLLLVQRGSQTIGGAVCLFFRDRMLVPWASSRREFLSSCPNNLLYWEAIQRACRTGYRSFDFGRSSPGSGTFRFKKQWGAVERPLHWQYVTTNGWRPSSLPQPDDRRYAWAVSAWRRLPVAVTKLVGPWVRRGITN